MIHYEQIIKGLNIRPSIGFFGYSSVTLIKDGGINILCDTGGYGVRQYISDLKEKIPVHKLFITHLHFDHCANLSLFKDIPIYIHRDELISLESNDSLYSDIYVFIKESIKDLNIIPFSSEDYLSPNTKIKFTPGHTIGHSSLEILNQDKNILIAGDAIETYQEFLDSNYDVDCFDINNYRKSYNQIKNKYSIIIPGHSSIISDGKLSNSKFELKTF